MSPAAQPSHFPDGTPMRLGRYRLTRPISTGGMARVFDGVRESLAGVTPRVAVKVILPQYADHPGFRELFVNEARIGSLLRHQNLVQIQDFDCIEGVYLLVMEYVEGVTLRQVIRRGRKHGVAPPLDVVVEIGRQVCDGLHHLHTAKSEDGQSLGLVHRDLKPSNLIMNPQGVVKLVDFGVSKALSVREHEGAVRGTWGYMPPEQARAKEVGPEADLFGLACVLYELVALKPLFPEKEAAEIKALMDQDEAARRAYQLVGSCGPLAGVLVRALQRDPMARFPSAAAMGRALGDLVSDPVVAREEVVRFQQRIAQLDPSAQTGPVAAQRPTAPPRRGSSPRARPVAPGALPVTVGNQVAPAIDTPPPSVGRPPAAPPLPWVAVAGAVFVLAAVLIIGFTAWRVLADPEPVPQPGVAAPAAAAPAATTLSAAEEAGVEEAGVEEAAVEEADGEAVAEVSESAAAASAETPSQPSGTTSAPAGGSSQAAQAGSTKPPTPNTSTSTLSSASPATAGGAATSPEGSSTTAEPPAAARDPAGTTGGAAAGTARGQAEPQASSGTSTEGQPGILTVSSIPRSQVILDGQFIRLSPLFRYKVDAGGHTVTLISEDGRRITFEVDIQAGKETRKVWSFDEGDWIDP